MAALLGLSVAAFVAPALADDCGCGGPKAYYAQRYGTVKPPQFNLLLGTTAPAAPTAAVPAAPTGTVTTTPVNPPATGSGG
jgi:hypothetical protein